MCSLNLDVKLQRDNDDNYLVEIDVPSKSIIQRMKLRLSKWLTDYRHP